MHVLQLFLFECRVSWASGLKFPQDFVIQNQKWSNWQFLANMYLLQVLNGSSLRTSECFVIGQSDNFGLSRHWIEKCSVEPSQLWVHLYNRRVRDFKIAWLSMDCRQKKKNKAKPIHVKPFSNQKVVKPKLKPRKKPDNFRLSIKNCSYSNRTKALRAKKHSFPNWCHIYLGSSAVDHPLRRRWAYICRTLHNAPLGWWNMQTFHRGWTGRLVLEELIKRQSFLQGVKGHSESH